MTIARNLVIVAALAAVVVFAPGGGTGSRVVLQTLGIVIMAALTWFAYRFYRENRITLLSLTEVHRVMLYVSLGVATLTLTATSKLWDTGAGTLAWFALLTASVAGAYIVYRAWREY